MRACYYRHAMNRSGSRNFHFHDLAPKTASFLDEVLAGFSKSHKGIPAKFFYDARGAELFDAICDLPEYYPTRTELAMMERHGAEIASLLGADCLLIEYGSGAGRKTRTLLDALQPAGYVPIDISREQLIASGMAIAQRHARSQVVAVCADYSFPINLPDLSAIAHRRKVVYFPGSSIGNFDPEETLHFLRNVAGVAGAGGGFLVGVDLKKDPNILHAAYNDAAGITAEFNLNLLARMNRELGANFDLTAFRHYAYYRAMKGWIEMHLLSLREQRVSIAGRQFYFREGESIHTEISCKYTVEEFQRIAEYVGFRAEQVWVDPERLFSIHYLTAQG
jgi:dimethylhistidine N-methyltransferase